MKFLHQDEGQVLDVPVIIFEEGDDAIKEQYKTFLEALEIYAKRNAKYKDNWKRMGWRGMLIRVRERAERLWDDLWDAEPGKQMDEGPDYDDAIDMINFGGFLVRAIKENNRDGEWWA